MLFVVLSIHMADDNVSSSVRDGKRSPFCDQTESGVCLRDNLDAWARLGQEDAATARAAIGRVDDAIVIIKAGRDAERIMRDVQNLAEESQEVELCNHCPRRRK